MTGAAENSPNTSADRVGPDTEGVFAPSGAPLGLRMLYGPVLALATLLALAAVFFGTESMTAQKTDAAFARYGEALEAERLFSDLSDGHALLMRASAMRGAGGDAQTVLRLAEEGGAAVASALGAVERLEAFELAARDRLQAYRVAAGHLQTVLAIEDFATGLATADASAKFAALRAAVETASAEALSLAAGARDTADAARREALLILGGVTLGGLVLALLVSISVSRGVSRPLSRIVDRVVALAHGDLDAPIPQSRRRDEVGAVAAALRVFRETARELHHRAFHDPLTGLLNRAGFERALAAHEKQDAPFALMLIDLDKFKHVNDTLGHDAGDALLMSVSGRVLKLLPEGWRCARLGGDEFGVLAPDMGALETAMNVASQIVEALSQPFEVLGQQAQIGASIGVAGWPRHGRDASQLFKHADLALYEAKGQGRGMAIVFDPSMTDGLERRRAIETLLRDKLARRALEVRYQPIVDIATSRPIGAEALVRLEGDAFGGVVITPTELIAAAEETRLIHALGAQVTERAIADAAEWPERMRLHVNVSTLELAEPDAAARYAKALARPEAEGVRLTLEVSERVFANVTPELEATMGSLSDNGVRFALDDFGAGSCALKALARLPFSDVKIDSSLVGALGRPGDAEGVIRTIAELARSLDLGVVAEGVETDEQRRYLDFVGAERAQGFLFAEPMTATQLKSWFDSCRDGRRVA